MGTVFSVCHLKAEKGFGKIVLVSELIGKMGDKIKTYVNQGQFNHRIGNCREFSCKAQLCRDKSFDGIM